MLGHAAEENESAMRQQPSVHLVYVCLDATRPRFVHAIWLDWAKAAAATMRLGYGEGRDARQRRVH